MSTRRLQAAIIEACEVGLDEFRKHRIPPSRVPELLEKVKRDTTVTGCILLATCNRSEWYLSGETDPAALLDTVGAMEGDWRFLRDEEVVCHLLEVFVGTRALLLGETEIVKQTMEALALAREHRLVDEMMESLFRAAKNKARRLRRRFRIAEGSITLRGVVGGFIEKTVRPPLRIGMVGTGRIAEDVCKRFPEKIAFVTAGRRFPRALELARKHGARAILPEELGATVREVNVLVCATAAPHYVLHPKHLSGFTGELLVIDLGVPPNVHPDTGQIPGIKVIGLQELIEVTEENRARKQRMLEHLKACCKKEGREIWQRLYVSVPEAAGCP